MVDTDDTRRTTPWVWHKLPTGELINNLTICDYQGVSVLVKVCRFPSADENEA